MGLFDNEKAKIYMSIRNKFKDSVWIIQGNFENNMVLGNGYKFNSEIKQIEIPYKELCKIASKKFVKEHIENGQIKVIDIFLSDESELLKNDIKLRDIEIALGVDKVFIVNSNAKLYENLSKLPYSEFGGQFAMNFGENPNEGMNFVHYLVELYLDNLWENDEKEQIIAEINASGYLNGKSFEELVEIRLNEKE